MEKADGGTSEASSASRDDVGADRGVARDDDAGVVTSPGRGPSLALLAQVEAAGRAYAKRFPAPKPVHCGDQTGPSWMISEYGPTHKERLHG